MRVKGTNLQVRTAGRFILPQMEAAFEFAVCDIIAVLSLGSIPIWQA